MVRLLLILIPVFLIVNCVTREIPVVKLDPIFDGKYDTEYPSKPAGKEINDIMDSVRLISSLVFYKQFYFTANQKVTLERIEKIIKENSSSAVVLEKPASGTATVIYSDQSQVALLTCAHTITNPDTVIYYHMNEKGQPSGYIESIGIKVRQTLNVVGLPRGGKVTVLAADPNLDLAIVGKRLTPPVTGLPPKSFKYPLGSAKELDWGTFVYLIGFPHGKKMISNTIVSNPNRDKKNTFIINATMYNGVSGGIIMALRDGSPNFELVGIANALSAKHSIKLNPDPYLNMNTINPTQPYKGDIYLQHETHIINGITFAIPAESIKKFMDDNRKELALKGYRFDHF